MSNKKPSFLRVVLLFAVVVVASGACGSPADGASPPGSASDAATVTPSEAASTQAVTWTSAPEPSAPAVEPSPTATPSPIPSVLPAIGTPNSPDKISRYQLGDIIDLGELTVAVLSWSSAGEDDRGFAADVDKKFVTVDLVIANRSTQTLQVSFVLNTRLLESSGQEYAFNGNGSLGGSLLPGQLSRGWLMFEVPQASNGFALALESQFYYRDGGGEDVIIDLGAQPTSLPLPEALHIKEPYLLPIGEVITHGDISLSVLGWHLQEGVGNRQPAQGMELVAVDALVTNLGSRPLIFDPSDHLILRDSSLREYWHDYRFPYIAEVPRSADISASPGERMRFSTIYQVPEGSGGYTLIYDPRDDWEPRAFVRLGEAPVMAELPGEQASQPAGEHAVGEAVSVGDVSLAVLGWQRSSGNENRQPETGNEFVLVDVLLVNHGNTVRSVTRLDVMLRDAELHQYQADYGYFDPPPWGDDGLLDVDVSPGERVRGKIAFEVPEGPAVYVLALDVGRTPGDKAFVALGPAPVSVEPPAELLAANPNAHKVGETVKQGGAAVSVLGWSLSAGQGDVLPEPDHLFLIVDVILTNESTEVLDENAPGFRPSVRDANGYVYSLDQVHYVGDRPAAQVFESGLQPGQQVRGQFLYQVRVDRGGYAFMFDPRWLFGMQAGEIIEFDLGREPVSTSP